MVDVLGWLRALPQPLLLLAVAATIVAEAGLLIGVFLPGASAAIALGVIARAGAVNPVLAASTVALAAVAGSHLAYLRGRAGALPTPRRLAGPREHAVRLLRRSGPLALCLAQWLVAVRTLTPRLAGVAGLDYRRFAVASVPSGLMWGAVLTMLGYLAAGAYDSLTRLFGFGAAGVVAVLAMAWLLVRRTVFTPRRLSR
ncbi:DedA family protein [Saccharomonospora sp. NPDC006951]